MQQRVNEWRRTHPGQEAQVAAAISLSQRRRLKMWAFLATNSHKVGMVLGAALPVSNLSVFGTLGLLWYFLYGIVVLNGWMVLLLLTQPRADRAVWDHLLESVSTRGNATDSI